MPRIRTLKPEHRQHRKIGPLTDRQYRLWVGMVCDADDQGRLVAEPEQLRVTIWGYHRKITAQHVAEALDTLAMVGLVVLYRVDGVLYAAFPSWTDHQKVDHPTNSRLPAPPLEPSREFASVRGGSEGSEGSEGIGREGIGVRPDGRTGALARNGFTIPEEYLSAVRRAPRLGQDPKLQTAEFWQAELRCNPGVNFPAELLKAEAWLTVHPERHYKRLSAFLHTWFSRADRPEA